MAAVLRCMTIAFLAFADGTEHSELMRPWERILADGGEPVLVAPGPGKIQTFDQLDPAEQIPVDVPLAEARGARFSALVLPGRAASPGAERADPAMIDFVRSFFDAGKPVAAICHAPWIIVEAGRVRGRNLTSWPSLRTGIEKAGGIWVDEPAVVCTRKPNVLVTSRRPQDLPLFCETMVNAFAVLGGH